MGRNEELAQEVVVETIGLKIVIIRAKENNRRKTC